MFEQSRGRFSFAKNGARNEVLPPEEFNPDGDSEGNDEADAGKQHVENITELGVNEVPQTVSDIHVITIIGQVEGHMVMPPQNKTTKYEHIIPQLVAVEESPDVQGLLLILNTVGGDVEAGLAISEMISTMRKPTVSLVLGGGHSIGVPIAVSATHSFIVPSATMTIHPIRLTGMVVGVQQSFDYLDRMQDRVIKFIVDHSGMREARLRSLMMETGELARDIGTIVAGEDAVRYGLIDEVGGLSQALSYLRQAIDAQKNAETSIKH